MSILRIVLLAIAVLGIAPVLIGYPGESFQAIALAVTTLSTASTLIFFAFALTGLLLGFDKRAARRIEQATPTHAPHVARDEATA